MIFSGVYITRLIIGIGMLDTIRGARKTIIMFPLGLEMMRLLGMVRRYIDGVYVMITLASEPAKGEGDAAEWSQPVPKPQLEQMETEAPTTAQEPPLVWIISHS